MTRLSEMAGRYARNEMSEEDVADYVMELEFRVRGLEAALEASRDSNTESLAMYRSACDRADHSQARVQELEEAVDAVRNLISNSEGVAGLHLNGDVAPWDELMEGGEYEAWLGALDAVSAEREEA